MRRVKNNLRLLTSRKMEENKDATNCWHKRLALQLTVQLPENHADAKLVLHYMQIVVDNFLNRPDNGDPFNNVPLSGRDD